MRASSRSLSSLIAAAALWVGSAAAAGPLLSATWQQSLQGVDVTVTNSGTTCTSTGANLFQQTITCPTGSGLNPTGTSSGGTYSVSLTLPAFSLVQFTTGGVINVRTAAAVAQGVQYISGNDSSAVGAPPIPGMVTVNVAGHVAKGANASQLVKGPTTLVKVPLSIGKAGTFTGYFYVLGIPHYITVDFYAWTPHTLSFTGLTTKGAALPDVVAMGSYDLVVLPPASKVPASQWVFGHVGGGTVTLVAPSKISIDGALAQRRTASFTSLTLTYLSSGPDAVHGTMVPEPDALLLLAGGAGLLLALRRRA
jgi:hypothetical protein